MSGSLSLIAVVSNVGKKHEIRTPAKIKMLSMPAPNETFYGEFWYSPSERR